jgi:dTDP-4-dehydrorhamnose 3,5-epimerase
VIFEPTEIAGAFVIRLEPHEDARGSFSRAFCKREMAAVGLDFDIAQANLVRTHHAGVVRGLHFQIDPAQESKMVRCLRGAVFDAICDMRQGSGTFRKVHTMRLDEMNRLALFIPGGVAHGYQTLVPDTEFFYLTDEFYVAGLEKGVRYSDPALGITWPLPPRDVATRDNEWPLL